MVLAVAEFNGAQDASDTEIGLTLSAINAGDLLVAALRVISATAVVTPPSGSWQQVVSPVVNGSLAQWMFYLEGATGAEADTVSFTTDVSVGKSLELWRITEAAATGALDKVSTSTGTGVTSTQPGSTGTLSQAAEVAIVAVGQSTGNGGSETIDSPWVAANFAAHARAQHGHLIVSSTAALNPTLAWATALDTASIIATFKAAGAVDLAGTVPMASSASASASVAQALAGSVPMAADVDGSLGLAQALAGTIPAATHTTGTARLAVGLAGSVPSASHATATLGAAVALAGSVPAASSATGTLINRNTRRPRLLLVED